VSSQIIKRPALTKEIIKKVALEIAHEVCKWANHRDMDADALAEDMAHEYSRGDNGYELAKKLDGRGYMPDAEMVESLDLMDSEVDNEYRKYCWEWVKKENIQPPFPVGTKIENNTIFSKFSGVISGVSRYYPACYEVPIANNPNAKRIVKFEDAVLMEN
jgi:hypothetical protein